MNWWSVDHVRNISDEYQHPISDAELAAEAASYLFFADYMIWSWAWAICCGDGPNRGKIAVISSPDRFVASSFSEFVDGYLRDPEGTCCP